VRTALNHVVDIFVRGIAGPRLRAATG